MRGLLLGVAAVCAALTLGSCGAAVEAIQADLQEQLGLNLPGASKPITTSPSSSPSTTGSTVDPAKDVSIAQMLEKHNTVRRQLGLSQLKADSALSLISQRQAAYNASIGRLSHEDAAGGQCWDRADAAGYPWRNIGENLAMSTNPQNIFGLWTNSPGHYKNMTNPVFNEIGLGKVIVGRSEYWAVVFARR